MKAAFAGKMWKDKGNGNWMRCVACTGKMWKDEGDGAGDARLLEGYGRNRAMGFGPQMLRFVRRIWKDGDKWELGMCIFL